VKTRWPPSAIVIYTAFARSTAASAERSEVTTRLVLALIISRIDYYNSALVGLPQSMTAPLQPVQNAAALLVFELGPKEHVTPSILQLHWLPVRWRVQFKICCLMHSIHRGNSPEYLKNIVRSVAASRPRHGLQSALSTDYVLPRLRTKLGELLSHTPVRQRETHCLKTFVLHQTMQFLENSSKLQNSLF